MQPVHHLIMSASLAASVAAAPQTPRPDFAAPVMLRSQSGDAIRVESPGYAAPCWADIDGDGQHDLLVGQFRDGKIKVYRGLAAAGEDSSNRSDRAIPELADGEWLMAEDEVAQVPGVW